MPRASGRHPAGCQILGQSSFQTQREIKSFTDWINKIHNGQNALQNGTIAETVFLNTKLRKIKYIRLSGH